MKIKNISLALLILLFFTVTANAQYGNGGLDRRISGQTGSFKSRKNDKPIDYVQASVDNISKNLNLDGFQSAIIKTILEDFKDKTIAISMEEIPDEGKNEKIKTEKDKMESKIMEILNPKQKEKFQDMKNKLDKKDKKKDKKDKKEEAETEE